MSHAAPRGTHILQGTPVPRLFVSASLAMILVACSDATNPTVARQLDAAVAATSSTIPFLPGARVSVLTVLDGTIYDPVALNDLGEIVGFGNNGSGTSDQSFEWTPHYGLHIRGSGVYSDSAASEAVSVNNAAQVLFIGAYGRTGIWDWQGNVRFLRPLSSFNPDCTPSQINDAGVSVGVCTAGGRSLATAWTKSGTPSALFINGGSTAVQANVQYPLEISDSNYIAGPLADGTGFVFTPSKQYRVLPIPVVSGSKLGSVRPLAVNNHGQAVGFSGGHGCIRRGAAWLSPRPSDRSRLLRLGDWYHGRRHDLRYLDRFGDRRPDRRRSNECGSPLSFAWARRRCGAQRRAKRGHGCEPCGKGAGKHRDIDWRPALRDLDTAIAVERPGGPRSQAAGASDGPHSDIRLWR